MSFVFSARSAAVLLLVLVIGVAAALPASAAVVSRVAVEGNTRVDAQTVESYLTIKPGESFGPADINASIDSLFATGLFADVEIAQSGSTLIVRVVENPVINRVSFEGNRRVSDETLEGAVQSRPRGVLTQARVQGDVQLILETYRRRGNFEASVEPQTIDLGQNRVDLVFEISEGGVAEVARISFIGNRSFSDGRLRDVIKTREAGLLGFLRTTDTYDPDRLISDQELIRQFYYNHGYADFRIISAVADFDRERNEFFITFTVEEGERYRFGDVIIETSLPELDPADLRRVVETRAGAVYSAEDVEDSLENLTLEAAARGYPFVQVRPRGDRDFETNTISIVYTLNEGVRAFIERINISGNVTTRDYVIRREFDVAEGDPFNRVLIDRAERRLKRLGFFENVRITTEQGSEEDRVIVNVVVEEKPTGAVSFGAGYSTSEGILGDISIEERNFLGRGQHVKLVLGGGSNTQNVEFSFTEPYFLGRRVAAGFDVFHRRTDATDTQVYDSQETGGVLRSTFPITENFAIQLFYKAFVRDVDIPNFAARCTGPARSFSLAICSSAGETLTSLAGFGLIYNSLDNQLRPRDGIYATSVYEFAGLGGDVAFFRNRNKVIGYHELLPASGVVGLLKGEAGLVTSLDDDGLRVQDQFFLGGSVIRGFESAGIGPRGAVTGEALGGRYFIAGTAEAFMPVPYLPPELGFDVAVFTDAGSLWDVDPTLVALNGGPSTIVSNGFDIRWSAGVGLAWASPFGPLRADFAWPIVKNNADETQVFRISGGTRF